MHVLCADFIQARLPRLTCEWASNLDCVLTHTEPVVQAPDLYHVYAEAMLPNDVVSGAMSGRSISEVIVGRQGKSGRVLQRHVRLCVMKLVRDVIWPAQNAYVETAACIKFITTLQVCHSALMVAFA